MLFKCSICSGAHYQPYYTWSIVHTTIATHNTVRGLKLINMYVFLKHSLLVILSKIHASESDQNSAPQQTKYNWFAQTLHQWKQSGRLYSFVWQVPKQQMPRSNLFPGPLVLWVYSTSIPTAICFESLSPSQDKTRHVCIHTCYYNHS